MKNYVALIMLLNIFFAFAKDKQDNDGITYRNALFTNSAQMEKECSKACKRNEKWTGNWRRSWGGFLNQCECQSDNAPKNKDKTINYRNIGTNKDSQVIHKECPKICDKNNETYTGNWQYGWFGRTLCECKAPIAKKS